MGRLIDKILGRNDSGRPLASGTTARADIGGRWTNETTGQGGVADRNAWTWFAPPLQLDASTIDDMLRFQAIGRRIVNREPDDCTREGYAVTGLEPGIAKALLDLAEGTNDDGTPGLDVSAKVADARRWARAFGGGAVYVLADDGQPASAPIDLRRLRAVRGLHAMDRFEIAVARYGMDPSNRATYGRPVMYQVGGSGHRPELVHASRVVPLQGNRLPLRVMLRNGGWGGSVLDLVWAELRNYGTTNDYVTTAITKMTQGVLSSTALADAVDAGDQDLVIKRVEALSAAMGVLGDLAIDKDRESYQVVQRSLSGIGEASDVVINALIAATDMPRSILMGLTPSGLNNGENSGELEAWYGHCESLHKPIYTPAVRRILYLILASREGPTGGQVPSGWEIEWRPLWTETESEKEDRRQKAAARRSLDVNAGIVSPTEARRDRDVVEAYGIAPGSEAPPPPEQPGGGFGGMDELEDDEGEPGDGPLPFETVIPKGETLMTKNAIAEQTGFSPNTIAGLAKRGQIRRWKLGGSVRFSMREVLGQIGRS